ncbi:Putative 115 kDa protein in type-1 retrotransposable element R1DM [Eumeta japonica]|uniref:115 kDa protein in type-1 retrotransposable element R1DM n=1 Tax=Eumeta variegata TaxID=151549 RepID=A0A4C1WKD2_EUMVA|nr:Putative 115 kDa protein in type-1 retrotransposable element R1DM [Eumeta japonica]
MVLTKKLKYDDPVVHMNGEQMSLVGEIRLLGLTIDRKLTFVPHVAKACKKASNIYKGLARAAKALSVGQGLSPEVVRTIYITVIEPIVLYTSCDWAPATGKLGVRKMLDAVQRSVALMACRAHRTVSLHSTLILSSLLPLDIRVREAVWLYEMKRGKDLGDTFVDRGSSRGPLVGPQIYTEGSRIEGKVGAALTEWRDGEETWYSTFRLDSLCTVFQAEMVALQRAIRRVKNGKDGLVNIFSDSKPSLEAGLCAYSGLEHAGIAGNEHADELARRVAVTKKDGSGIRSVSAVAREKGDQGGEPGRVATTIRRGKHCNCLGLSCETHPHCACDPAKTQDMLHVLEDCDMFLRERAALEAGIGVAISRRHFPEILSDASKRDRFVTYCVDIVKRCNKMNRDN